MTDRYTRAVLTVIAIALVVIAARGLSPIAPAYASDAISCKVEGPMSIRDEVRVKLDSYGLPGYSSGSPLYVKQVD